MKIVHYLLGLPPIRSGGLVRYAIDLAEEQSKEDSVFFLLPGPISKVKTTRRKVTIRRKGNWKGIPKYRIYNPLPIPMGNGIRDIQWFTESCDNKAYRDFLRNLKPDVIHVHTMMGLHKEFLEIAMEMKIPVVYTTHDYFGICPCTNMLYKGNVCDAPGEFCEECCKYAFSEKRLILEQSTAYGIYRSSDFFIKLLRLRILRRFMKSFRSQTPEKAAMQENKENQEVQFERNDYAELLKYYREMFGLVSCFHFNSSLARSVFVHHLGELPGEVITISNKSVTDKRKLRKQEGVLKVGFVGGDSEFKGLSRLQKNISELYMKDVKGIELQVYGSLERANYSFCKYYDAYTEDERDRVFEGMDILAVPSSCRETFGMVVLEALSYGVPVVVTDKVGAKEIFENRREELGIILPDEDECWKSCLAELAGNRDRIALYNKNICKSNIELDYVEHVKRIRKMLERLIEKQS